MATGPSTEISLLSLADAKVWVKSTSTTDNDGVISDIINAISLRFNDETGRNLKTASYTETYNGNGKGFLYLDNAPLSSTAITITIDGTRAFDDTGDVVTSTDVMLDTGQGRIDLDNKTFAVGTNNVQVEYSAGYSTSDEFTLVQAAKEFLGLQWNRYTHKELVNVRSESHEGGSVTYESDMPWSVKQVLKMYKDMRVV